MVSTALLPPGSSANPINVNDARPERLPERDPRGRQPPATRPASRSPTAATSTARPASVDDLLIGAPRASGAGAAYLVYGGNNLASLATTVTHSTGATIRYIYLSNVGATTGTVPGAIITGPPPAAVDSAICRQLGRATSTADGFADIMIGSPTSSSSSTADRPGRSLPALRCGQHSAAYLTGTIPLATIPRRPSRRSRSGGRRR